MGYIQDGSACFDFDHAACLMVLLPTRVERCFVMILVVVVQFKFAFGGDFVLVL